MVVWKALRSLFCRRKCEVFGLYWPRRTEFTTTTASFFEKNLYPSKKKARLSPFLTVCMYVQYKPIYLFTSKHKSSSVRRIRTLHPFSFFLLLVLYTTVVAVVAGGSSITKSKSRGLFLSSSASKTTRPDYSFRFLCRLFWGAVERMRSKVLTTLFQITISY